MGFFTLSSKIKINPKNLSEVMTGSPQLTRLELFSGANA
jgi:hypothetical protein